MGEDRALITTRAAELREALPAGGALMALDIGTKTIGTAFCDTGWSFATAGITLPRGKFTADKSKRRASSSAGKTSSPSPGDHPISAR